MRSSPYALLTLGCDEGEVWARSDAQSEIVLLDHLEIDVNCRQKGGVIMDVTNAEQVCSFRVCSVQLCQLKTARLALLKKLVHVPSWLLRESQRTSASKEVSLAW